MTTNHEEIIRTIGTIRRTPGFKPYERRAFVTDFILKTLRDEGRFFRTSEGNFYYHTPTLQLYPLEERSRNLSAFIERMFGLNDAEVRDYQHVVTAVMNHAYREGQRMPVYRLAHYDLDQAKLYVSRFDGQMYRLDGEHIDLVWNGTDNIFFWDGPEWQPYVTEKHDGPGLFERIMLDPVNFSSDGKMASDEQRWLYKKWLLSQFFDSLHPTKPLLLFNGEKGSGKTSAARKWLKLLFGTAGEVTGLERGKPDGFIATVSSQPIAVFDNVDGHIGWLLAQLDTGLAIGRRLLYTTNEQIRFVPNCWIALTSRTPEFLNRRDDVLDRTIILQMGRLPLNIPEHELLHEIKKRRNQLWAELLDELNDIVALLRNGEPTGEIACRMADFGHFVMLLAKGQNQEAKARRILKAMQGEQGRVLCELEPIYECLANWLEQPGNPGRCVTSSELSRELWPIALQLGIDWPYREPKSLAQRLRNIWENLKDRFRAEANPDTSNQKHYTFWPKTESLDVAESSSSANHNAHATDTSLVPQAT